jgi:hypothetical protein
MRPCDCTDQHKADQLNEQGISYNNRSLGVAGGQATIRMPGVTVMMPVGQLRKLVEWFMED